MSRSRRGFPGSLSSVIKKPFAIVVILVVLALAGALAFLATWDIPAPSTRIERVIPNDRLPR